MIYSRAGLDYWGRLLYEAFYFVQQLKGGSDSKPKKFFPTYKPKAAFPPPPISLAGLYRHVLHYPVLADKTDQQFILVDERFKTLLEENVTLPKQDNESRSPVGAGGRLKGTKMDAQTYTQYESELSASPLLVSQGSKKSVGTTSAGVSISSKKSANQPEEEPSGPYAGDFYRLHEEFPRVLKKFANGSKTKLTSTSSRMSFV